MHDRFLPTARKIREYGLTTKGVVRYTQLWPTLLQEFFEERAQAVNSLMSEAEQHEIVDPQPHSLFNSPFMLNPDALWQAAASEAFEGMRSWESAYFLLACAFARRKDLSTGLDCLWRADLCSRMRVDYEMTNEEISWVFKHQQTDQQSAVFMNSIIFSVEDDWSEALAGMIKEIAARPEPEAEEQDSAA